jgi:hypothetical protein
MSADERLTSPATPVKPLQIDLAGHDLRLDKRLPSAESERLSRRSSNSPAELGLTTVDAIHVAVDDPIDGDHDDLAVVDALKLVRLRDRPWVDLAPGIMFLLCTAAFVAIGIYLAVKADVWLLPFFVTFSRFWDFVFIKSHSYFLCC